VEGGQRYERDDMKLRPLLLVWYGSYCVLRLGFVRFIPLLALFLAFDSGKDG
jgi:hypothetical protein